MNRAISASMNVVIAASVFAASGGALGNEPQVSAQLAGVHRSGIQSLTDGAAGAFSVTGDGKFVVALDRQRRQITLVPTNPETGKLGELRRISLPPSLAFARGVVVMPKSGRLVLARTIDGALFVPRDPVAVLYARETATIDENERGSQKCYFPEAFRYSAISDIKVASRDQVIAFACSSANALILYAVDEGTGKVRLAWVGQHDAQLRSIPVVLAGNAKSSGSVAALPFFEGPRNVCISDNAKHIYVLTTADVSNGLHQLEIGDAVEEVRVAQVLRDVKNEEFNAGLFQGIFGGCGLACSPDGRRVYVTSFSRSIAAFARDATTDKLVFDYMIQGGEIASVHFPKRYSSLLDDHPYHCVAVPKHDFAIASVQGARLVAVSGKGGTQWIHEVKVIGGDADAAARQSKEIIAIASSRDGKYLYVLLSSGDLQALEIQVKE